MTTCLTFVLALNRARLNSLPPALVCRNTPSVDVLKAYDSIMEKNYAKYCRCQNASLFYSTVDIEWFGCCSVVVDCSLHVVMEGGDHTH